MDNGAFYYVRHARFDEKVFPAYGKHFDEYKWPDEGQDDAESASEEDAD